MGAGTADRSASLILSGGRPVPLTRMVQGRVGGGASSDGDGFDFRIDPDASVAEQAALLAQWLPPSLDALERMEASFGRSALEPLLAGLASELTSAITAIDLGQMPNAHKLAGVSGTFGFHDVGESWRAIDQGAGDLCDARRLSRTAVIAIDHWLESQDHA